MYDRAMKLIRFTVVLACAWGLAKPCLMAAESDAMNFEIRLIWGTDQPKTDDKALYAPPKAMTDKIRKVFKWKNYYGVRHKGQTRHLKAVKKGKTSKVEVSDQCKLEIWNRDGRWVEVKLFGEGELLVTQKQKVVPEELLLFCGDCKKDESAWFVLLKPLKELPKEEPPAKK